MVISQWFPTLREPGTKNVESVCVWQCMCLTQCAQGVEWSWRRFLEGNASVKNWKIPSSMGLAGSYRENCKMHMNHYTIQRLPLTWEQINIVFYWQQPGGQVDNSGWYASQTGVITGLWMLPPQCQIRQALVSSYLVYAWFRNSTKLRLLRLLSKKKKSWRQAIQAPRKLLARLERKVSTRVSERSLAYWASVSVWKLYVFLAIVVPLYIS